MTKYNRYEKAGELRVEVEEQWLRKGSGNRQELATTEQDLYKS